MNPAPLDITVDRAQRRMTIRWNDEHDSVYSLEYLRAICPCAHCDTTKHGGSPNDDMVPERFVEIAVLDVSEVGRYALRFVWSDRHDAGIYGYDYLRAKCPCDLCSKSV